jgi:hypothetical protein
MQVPATRHDVAGWNDQWSTDAFLDNLANKLATLTVNNTESV